MIAQAAQPPPISPQAQQALKGLADVVQPEPVAWTPQTWGWAALAALLAALVIWLVVRAVRQHRANRYRIEALADLAALEKKLSDDAGRAAALGAMPALLKRVALAAWPRPDVAALSGQAWIDFLRAHGGRHGFADESARLLADGEYDGAALASMTADDARRAASGLRRWIEGHRVRP
jgi:hypothetical protein